MPVTDSFLAACRTAVAALPELTAFRAALTSLGSATRTARAAAWVAAYDDNASPAKSPAQRLRKAIRETVLAQADAVGTLSALDRESAYRTLAGEFVPAYPTPLTAAQEDAELQRVLTADRLS